MTDLERMRAVYAASKSLYLAESTPMPGESIAELELESEARAKRTIRELMRWRTIMAEVIADEEKTS